MQGSRIGSHAAQAGSRSARRLDASRPLRAVVAVGAAVILLIVAGAILVGIELRDREIRSARRELNTLNTVLAEETSRAFQSVDLVLLSLLEQFRTEGIDTAEAYRTRKAGVDTFELLRSKIAGLPQLDAVTMIDTSGRLINFSRFYPIPQVDVSDRDYFKALSHPGEVEPFLSEPVENRGTGTWTVYLARRVLSRNGTTIGLLLAAIDLQYFDAFYSTLKLDRGDAISIWRRDGTLYARYPSSAQVPRKVAEAIFSRLAPAEPGEIEDVAQGFDGRRRLVARRLVSDFPLVIVVSRTMRGVLADWRNQALLTGITSALAILAVLVVMMALARQFRAYEELGLALRQREEAMAAREQAEAKLRQSQKLEAMGQLTSGVAHDFNNFLTVVIGNLEMIERRLPETEPLLRRYVESALAGAGRAAALTKRLLAFSRRQELEPQQIDVNGLIDGMADILRQTLSTIVLRLDLAPDIWPIFADPHQLESALLNLVVNARDAMPGGGRVEISTRNVAAHYTAPAHVEITVGDTGTGMSPEVAQKAFEPFFTTKEAGRGTGLGLAQVQSFTHEAQGEVSIETAPGKGTRVRLLLPPHRLASPGGSATLGGKVAAARPD